MSEAKLKRGTPEFRAYMRALAAKGGRATAAKPGHLQEIAAAGGRATKGIKKKHKPKPLGPSQAPRFATAIDSLDAILGELG